MSARRLVGSSARLGDTTVNHLQFAIHPGFVISAYGFGLRHGVDWDDIAVIADITNSQVDRRRA